MVVGCIRWLVYCLHFSQAHSTRPYLTWRGEKRVKWLVTSSNHIPLFRSLASSEQKVKNTHALFNQGPSSPIPHPPSVHFTLPFSCSPLIRYHSRRSPVDPKVSKHMFFMWTLDMCNIVSSPFSFSCLFFSRCMHGMWVLQIAYLSILSFPRALRTVSFFFFRPVDMDPQTFHVALHLF